MNLFPDLFLIVIKFMNNAKLSSLEFASELLLFMVRFILIVGFIFVMLVLLGFVLKFFLFQPSQSGVFVNWVFSIIVRDEVLYFSIRILFLLILALKSSRFKSVHLRERTYR
jgi:hypothetical protein